MARAAPGVMPRVMDILSRKGLMPRRWHSTVYGRHDDELHIDIEVDWQPPDVAAVIAARIRQVLDVELVLMADKVAAMSA